MEPFQKAVTRVPRALNTGFKMAGKKGHQYQNPLVKNWRQRNTWEAGQAVWSGGSRGRKHGPGGFRTSTLQSSVPQERELYTTHGFAVHSAGL